MLMVLNIYVHHHSPLLPTSIRMPHLIFRLQKILTNLIYRSHLYHPLIRTIMRMPNLIHRLNIRITNPILILYNDYPHIPTSMIIPRLIFYVHRGKPIYRAKRMHIPSFRNHRPQLIRITKMMAHHSLM